MSDTVRKQRNSNNQEPKWFKCYRKTSVIPSSEANIVNLESDERDEILPRLNFPSVVTIILSVLRVSVSQRLLLLQASE